MIEIAIVVPLLDGPKVDVKRIGPANPCFIATRVCCGAQNSRLRAPFWLAARLVSAFCSSRA